MKKVLINYLQKSLLAAFVFLSSTSAFASHIVGSDLYYKHVSGNTYQIVVALYGDCGSTTGAYNTLGVANPQVCVYDGGTSVTTLSLAIDTPYCGVLISPLCTGDTSQCTAFTYTTPGIQKFVYRATYTLPHTSSTWRFIYTGGNGTTFGSWSCPGTTLGTGSGGPASGGRSAAITNVSSSGATMIQLIDTLNNSTSDNSSPDLTVSQTTFFCASQPDSYNPLAVDPDGDILTYSLIDATNGSATCSSIGGGVSYTAGLSGANPLQLHTGTLGFNTSTGLLTFNPAIQRSVVVYNIEERRSGVLVGTSQREMTVLALTCGSVFPCLAVTTLTNEVAQNNDVEIFPNPSNSLLTLKVPGGTYSSLTVANSIGQVLLQQHISSAQTIDVRFLPCGVYYLTLRGQQGTRMRKFVKN